MRTNTANSFAPARFPTPDRSLGRRCFTAALSRAQPANAPTMAELPISGSPFATRWHPSPNNGERRLSLDRPPARQPDCIVLHYTGMRDAVSAIEQLCTPSSQVSCHYVVEEDGNIVQLVCESRRAWHAGASFWRGETDLNSTSVGIEIVNVGHGIPPEPFGYPPFPERQIEAVLALCQDIAARWRMPAENLLAHSDIAPRRKIDPGEHFPWTRFAQAGLGLYTPPLDPATRDPDGETPAYDEAAPLLSALGFNVPAADPSNAELDAAIRAVQRHWRPARIDGRWDETTAQTVRNLLTHRQELNGRLYSAATA